MPPLNPDSWADPFLTYQTAQNLLGQTGHILFKNPSNPHAHLLARVVPGEPADVLTLWVAPEHRRQGLALQLLHKLEAEARRQGCPSITLEVRPSNTAAVTLYQAQGYTVIGRRPGYYAHPVEDAVVYSKNLG